MQIKTLIVQNLRNHSFSEIELSKLNVFYGMNGSGKTSILESVCICCITKSFLQVQDSSLIKFDNDSFFVETKSRTDLNTNFKISVEYQSGKKKSINGTLGDRLQAKDVIGFQPVVALSPDFKNITFGSPADRRQFLDRLLSQVSKRYLSDLMKLKKSLKHRNSLLLEAKKSGEFDNSLFETWSELFIETAAQIIHRRYSFFEDFKDYYQKYYKIITDSAEIVSLDYQPDSFSNLDPEILRNVDKISEKLSERFQAIKSSEIKRGTTLFGPQKDELIFKINDSLARETASQGQHKSMLISLKFAEFDYLKTKNSETPIILLDDLFSELDRTRTKLVMDLIKEFSAQTFITLTEPDFLKTIIPSSDENYYFSVDSGKVEREEL